ncbi:hypothetical protein B296_00006557 [Ensete ventricosum]|uniref:Uncharacterized protein n=1 Tax=Ensete ventricosum TaxID=4639 RepID=A0A426ZK72_ENSVE|nr:hypothetical protein B296_00006557 [Ensete ventricosum]
MSWGSGHECKRSSIRCRRVATPTGVIVSPVFTLRFEDDPRITPGSRPFLNFRTGIGFPCRGANATRSRAAHYDVYLPLHRTFWMEGQLVQLHYVPVKVAVTYEILDLVLQIIALLRIVPVVVVETTITSVVSVLGSRPHRVGGFEESLLSDLEKNLSLSGVERDIERSRNGLLTSLHPPWSPGGVPRESSARGRF